MTRRELEAAVRAALGDAGAFTSNPRVIKDILAAADSYAALMVELHARPAPQPPPWDGEEPW